MIIKNQLRPTMIRTNSRYRGQTELIKFTNFVQEAVHDIKMLSNVMSGNSHMKKQGHSDYIYNNFAKLVNGTTEGIASNAPSASLLCHPTDDIFKNLNLLGPEWVTYGNCVKGGVQEAITLESPGTADPSGVATQLLVEEGQIIYIRLAVRLLSGNTSTFAIGSDNITKGEVTGDIKTFSVPQNGATIYIDKRLYCQHREAVNINIDVHRLPQTLEAAKVEVSEIEIRYMTENNVALESSNSGLKPRINLLNDKVSNIVTNM